MITSTKSIISPQYISSSFILPPLLGSEITGEKFPYLYALFTPPVVSTPKVEEIMQSSIFYSISI